MQQNETLPLEDNEGENGDYLFPEIDDASFEETMSSAIAEIMEKHRSANDDESLEKAITTEDIASAKRRGLVPQSGDWQRPKRWVRPKDADVPVDEGNKPRKKASLDSKVLNAKKADSIVRAVLKNFPNNGLETLSEIYSISLENFSTSIIALEGMGEDDDDDDYDISSEDTFILDIDVLNEKGKSVGDMTREFSISSGKLVVEHQSFHLHDEAQNNGIAVDMNEHIEEEYEKLGVSEVILSANAKIGGYAWARQGYDFSGKPALEQTRKRFLDLIDKIDLHEIKPKSSSKLSSTILRDQIKSFTHSWEFAAWNPTNVPHGEHIGKKWMLGSSWGATKKLDKNSKGYKIGKGYFAAKRNEKNTS